MTPGIRTRWGSARGFTPSRQKPESRLPLQAGSGETGGPESRLPLPSRERGHGLPLPGWGRGPRIASLLCSTD
jgi:hypothetical protein